MKKILRKMMSFVMAVFMVLQVMLPAFASSSKAEEEKPNCYRKFIFVLFLFAFVINFL